MNKALLVLPILVLAFALPAQKDTIELLDGTKIRGVKVISWTAKEIKFKTNSGSGTESRPAHEVRGATISRVQVILSRAGDDTEQLIGEADNDDPLIKQACFFKASQIFAAENTKEGAQKMLSALSEIDTQLPDSAYAPAYHRTKIRYYLSQAKPQFNNAKIAAEKYGDASRTRSWSNAYVYDAEYWEKRIAGATGKVKMEDLITSLKEIKAKTTVEAPFVSHAASIDLADVYRNAKNYKVAEAEYEGLHDKKGLEPDVRARMYIGLGYIYLEKAVISKSKGDYHNAFKNFLKVYLNAKAAHPEYVAEGLYNAAKACEQWNELPTCKQMAGRLRGRLKLREPWRHTKWALRR